MVTYSSKRVAFCCIATGILTVGMGALWMNLPGVRTDLGLAQRVCVSDWTLPPVSDAPVARDELGRRSEGTVAQRDSVMSQEERDDLMNMLLSIELPKNMYWLGVPVLKSPTDMWMMQQVLAEVRPDYIVEAGTWRGGSALYFAHVLEGLGLSDSKVVTIDIADLTRAVSRQPLWSKRVEFIHGSSTDPEVIAEVKRRVAGKRVLVVLDSLHLALHVAAEIEAYSPLVSPGSYLIVEDTGLDRYSRIPGWQGPNRAVTDFLATDAGSDFEVDLSREAFMITLHPGGWLKRKS